MARRRSLVDGRAGGSTLLRSRPPERADRVRLPRPRRGMLVYPERLESLGPDDAPGEPSDGVDRPEPSARCECQEVRRRAGSARVAAHGGHRRLIADFRGDLHRASLPDLLQGRTVTEVCDGRSAAAAKRSPFGLFARSRSARVDVVLAPGGQPTSKMSWRSKNAASGSSPCALRSRRSRT